MPAETESTFEVAVAPTVRAAALRHSIERMQGALTLLPVDLRKKIRKQVCSSLLVFVVDASDSMGSGLEGRMKAAKGAVLALLTFAYQKRNKVALVALRGEAARVILPPTTSIVRAKESLRWLATGGATPLAGGLNQAWQLIKLERSRSPELRPMLVLISDGEANVPLQKGAPVMSELLSLAALIRKDKIRSIVLDSKLTSSSEMLRLAQALGSEYHHVYSLHAGDVLEHLRFL